MIIIWQNEAPERRRLCEISWLAQADCLKYLSVDICCFICTCFFIWNIIGGTWSMNMSGIQIEFATRG